MEGTLLIEKKNLSRQNNECGIYEKRRTSLLGTKINPF